MDGTKPACSVGLRIPGQLDVDLAAMTALFRIRIIVRRNGERLPLVTCGHQVEPLSAAYAMCRLRLLSGSFNTVLTPMMAVCLLMSFCAAAGIELFERLRQGRLLLGEEWRRFQSGLRQKANKITVTRRTRDVLNFLEFWVRWFADTIPDTEVHDSYLARAAFKLKGMRTDAADPVGRNPAKRGRRRDAVPLEAVRLLVGILSDERAMERLWPNRLVRLRNGLILRWLLVLGHREGELLGLLLSDLHVDGGRGTISIVRRQDDPRDSRRRQPSVKGEDRTVDFPPQLHGALSAWLSVRGSTCPATEHLVVSLAGRPLSAASLAKVFRRLGDVYSEFGKISPHNLRHTWVSTARSVGEASGDSGQAVRKAMAKQLGWSDLASEAFYGHAQKREAADELVLRVQEALLQQILPSPAELQ